MIGWLRTVIVLVCAVTVAAFSIAACGTNESEPSGGAPDRPAPSTATDIEPSLKKSDSPQQASPQPSTLKVPTNLVGQPLGKTKRRLAKIGFTNVVIAGGNVTDTDTVASVPRSGEKLGPDAKLVVVGHESQPLSKPPSQRGEATPETGRPPPKAGYQCRPGDENRYPVCAGHKKWVDDQYEWGCQQGYIKDKACSRFQ